MYSFNVLPNSLIAAQYATSQRQHTLSKFKQERHKKSHSRHMQPEILQFSRQAGGAKNFVRIWVMVLIGFFENSKPDPYPGDKLDMGRQLKIGPLCVKMPKIAQYPFIGRHLAKHLYVLCNILVANHSHGISEETPAST